MEREKKEQFQKPSDYPEVAGSLLESLKEEEARFITGAAAQLLKSLFVVIQRRYSFGLEAVAERTHTRLACEVIYHAEPTGWGY